MNKLYAVGLIAMLFCAVGVLYEDNFNDSQGSTEQLYQGPVPIGYNLTHFRETGETTKEDYNGNN